MNNPFSVVQNFVGDISKKFVLSPSNTSFGIENYVFDVMDNERIEMTSEITDHYVEDNYSIQDHVVQRPIRYTMTGYVGELTYVANSGIGGILGTLGTLTSVASIVPAFSAQAGQAYSKIASVSTAAMGYVNTAKNMWDIFLGKDTSDSKQKQAFDFLSRLWKHRILCNVVTPWGSFDKMLIEDVRPVQEGNSRGISNFAVTVKQIRVLEALQTTRVGIGLDRMADTLASPVDIGQTTGSPTDSLKTMNPYALKSPSFKTNISLGQ